MAPRITPVGGDIDRVLEDNYSTNGTSGCGLGAVRRLMDAFEIRSRVSDSRHGGSDDGRSPAGTLVTTAKWVAGKPRPKHFEYSVNSRPCVGEKANGDGVFVFEDQAGLLLAVVDGLGHGPDAARASEAVFELGGRRGLWLEHVRFACAHPTRSISLGCKQMRRRR